MRFKVPNVRCAEEEEKETLTSVPAAFFSLVLLVLGKMPIDYQLMCLRLCDARDIPANNIVPFIFVIFRFHSHKFVHFFLVLAHQGVIENA